MTSCSSRNSLYQIDVIADFNIVLSYQFIALYYGKINNYERVELNFYIGRYSMTKQSVRRVLEIGSVLLFVVVIAVMGFVAGQGRDVEASEVEYICSSYPYPACGCSEGYPGIPDQPGYPGTPAYPGAPEDCLQFLPAITVPYPGQ